MAVDVGAGSAGCVLASRLSENTARTVLLIEAGPDYSTLSELPDDIGDASQPTLSHDWGCLAERDSLGQVASLPRARLVGGCSATNGCFAVRGSPADRRVRQPCNPRAFRNRTRRTARRPRHRRGRRTRRRRREPYRPSDRLVGFRHARAITCAGRPPSSHPTSGAASSAAHNDGVSLPIAPPTRAA